MAEPKPGAKNVAVRVLWISGDCLAGQEPDAPKPVVHRIDSAGELLYLTAPTDKGVVRVGWPFRHHG